MEKKTRPLKGKGLWLCFPHTRTGFCGHLLVADWAWPPSHAGPGASLSSTSSPESRAKCRHSMAVVDRSQSFFPIMWSICRVMLSMYCSCCELRLHGPVFPWAAGGVGVVYRRREAGRSSCKAAYGITNLPGVSLQICASDCKCTFFGAMDRWRFSISETTPEEKKHL